ncbi:unnamed protein product [Mytilus edulis]|uniref:Uncharacterized protein n=1 Tax=Mytilus edulis TaxID=6550 RepID=A0A8S3TP23_MYTED|nr:unnamed protein product [Mytilus edulis]
MIDGYIFVLQKCYFSIGLLPVIGKRSGDTTECSKCCNSSYCNLETCDKPYANITHFKLITPPPLTFCRDNSASICAANPSQCSQEYYKFYQCPDTCNQSIMCYDCDAFPHQRDCDRVAECGPNMECYVSIGLLPVIGKRSGETTECSKCCNSSYCNLETCDKPYASIPQADEYCAQCCDGNNCNRDICGQRTFEKGKRFKRSGVWSRFPYFC